MGRPFFASGVIPGLTRDPVFADQANKKRISPHKTGLWRALGCEKQVKFHSENSNQSVAAGPLSSI